MNYNFIIVGSGYAGSICARVLAEQNKTVLIIERRNTFAGNMFDYQDVETGILVQKYGPHISAMNNDNIYNFLSKYTEWTPYIHYSKAVVNIEGSEVSVPLPVNFTSLQYLFPQTYRHYTGYKRV